MLKKVLLLGQEKWKDLADCNHSKKMLKRIIAAISCFPHSIVV
jgi:hypothetical protein